MSEEKLDLGAVQVHKKVIEEVVATAISEIDGVSLPKADFSTKVMKLFGQKSFPGINVKVDEKGQASLEVKVYVRYGMNIPNTGVKIQDALKQAIEKTVDIQLKDIDVNVQGVERG
ncbi:MAG: Asp23/Gls24 family envelope stress response protein [Candidatus Omnitrophica bacterium]|nr:Asp23/Gls24 family envelope stress response protein [Candidatus Omnitrophota bacterium]